MNAGYSAKFSRKTLSMTIREIVDGKSQAFFISATFARDAASFYGRQYGYFADSSDGFGSCPIEFYARRLRTLAVNHGNLKFMTYQKCLIRAKSDTDFIPAPEPGLSDLARKKSR